MMPQNAIIIFGPTASGKSALALALARQLNGEIINMDSMQIYYDLKILSASPSEDEKSEIPHHLFNFMSGNEDFSTGKWLEFAKDKIREIRKRGNLPIIVGGTGLYANALTKGLIEIAEIPEKIRNSVRELVKNDKIAAFSELKKIDSETASKINENDSLRISRALEVYRTFKIPLSEIHAQTQKPFLSAKEFKGFCLLPPRDILKARIEKRFAQMIKNGAIDEVKALKKKNLAPNKNILKTLGYVQISSFLDGEISLDQAIENSIIKSNQYAKRQYTWARGRAKDFVNITQIDTPSQMEFIIKHT